MTVVVRFATYWPDSTRIGFEGEDDPTYRYVSTFIATRPLKP